MGLFPPSFIEDLKAQADIVQVVQDYVPLKKAGSSYRGLCPFHSEKTPSFHVHRDRGFFHCFGCGAGGDALKFLKRWASRTPSVTWPSVSVSRFRNQTTNVTQLPRQNERLYLEYTRSLPISSATA